MSFRVTMPPLPMSKDHIQSEGYRQARSMLDACSTEHGFVTSNTDKDNYKRIWARDGVIIGLSALLTKDKKLQSTFLATLQTLRKHQGPHGEIPSNVEPQSGAVSLGGTTGRVDADLWYIIGCEAYWNATHDEKFLHEFFPSIRKTEFLLGCWEFNNRGLLYVPQTGDWTDEYIQHGYVLYDQLLYWRALRGMYNLCKAAEADRCEDLKRKSEHLKDLIRTNYWFVSCEQDPPGAYHPVLHRKGCEAAQHRNQHWMAFFSPTGYGYRFDALANVLVSLLGIADDDQRKRVDDFIVKDVVHPDMQLLPAFYPVIQPETDSWNELEVSFSFTFKNKPYEFHNGGLWPFVTGFYVADLAKRGKTELAETYLRNIDAANRLSAQDNDEWGFYEYIHGKNHTPGGTRHQGWSAAASVMAHHALDGQYIL